MDRFFFILLFCWSSLGWTQPHLEITPQEIGILDPVKIEVSGLQSEEQIEIQATLFDEEGRKWQSTASFKANREGMVNLATDSPLSGTYSVTDPMGLFWSMQLDPHAKNQAIFSHEGLTPLIIDIDVQTENGDKLTQQVIRQVARSGIQKIPVREEGIEGTLFLPEGEGPFPGIIVLGGSSCGYPRDSYIVQFANEGYAALGVAYCKTPGTSSHLVEVPLETFERSIAWMKKADKISVDTLFIAGTSAGGVAALASAVQYPDIKGVISFVGRGFIPQAIDTGDRNDIPRPMFTFQGKPLPFLPAYIPPLTKASYAGGYFLQTALTDFLKLNQKQIDQLAIPVEKIQGPILIMATLSDRIAGSASLCEVSYNRLVNSNFPYPYEFIVYKGAGHTLGMGLMPYCPSTVTLTRYVKRINSYYDLGGNPADNAAAVVDSWKRTFAFLEKYVSRAEQ